MRSHSSDRPYTCPTCGKTYKFSDHLYTHMRVHSGEKPYKCDECARTFSACSNLNLHKKSHSIKREKFMCSTCSRTYRSRELLAKHEFNHKKNIHCEYQCQMCSVSFSKAVKFQEHVKIHRHHANSSPIC